MLQIYYVEGMFSVRYVLYIEISTDFTWCQVLDRVYNVAFKAFDLTWCQVLDGVYNVTFKAFDLTWCQVLDRVYNVTFKAFDLYKSEAGNMALY